MSVLEEYHARMQEFPVATIGAKVVILRTSATIDPATKCEYAFLNGIEGVVVGKTWSGKFKVVFNGVYDKREIRKFSQFQLRVIG
jgi:hypothetical protein